MSIVPMRRVAVCGAASEKTALIAGLQRLGCLHLATRPDPEAAPAADDGLDPARARAALRYLRDAPYVRRDRGGGAADDPAAMVRSVLANKERRRELREQRDELRERLDALAPWGEFTLPDPESLGGYRPWFHAVPHRHADALTNLDLPWHEAARDHRRRYIVVLARARPPAGALPVAPTPCDGRGTATLRAELRDIETKLEDVEVERIALTRHIPALRRALTEARNTAAYREAVAHAREHDGVIGVEGWAPAPAVPAIRRFARRHAAAVLTRPPASDELPPTLLANRAWARPGEDLAHFYQVPPARDWDPSAALLLSFALFFAAILSDAGYGAMVTLLGLLPLGWWQSAAGARVRRMTVLLGLTSVAVGVLTGSYFGVPPPPDSLLAAAHVVEPRAYSDAMELAVIIGVLHIALANAAWARAHWPSPPAVARLGWIAIAAGGYGLWLTGAEAPGGWLAGGAVAVGLLGVVAFAGERPVRRPWDVLKRAADGLAAAANITKLAGDVLSYLRLFALGLATAMLAAAFNDIAGQAAAGVAGVGVLAGALVALAGHTLTFALAVVSGVVHGLRLDYIEFYGWALNGEGYPYTPLRREETPA